MTDITRRQLTKLILSAHVPLRLFVVFGMLLSMLSVVVPGAAAASITSATFSGDVGAVTSTVDGVLYAKPGTKLKLTVVTDANTKCVNVTGAVTGRITSGNSPFVFTFTAGSGPGTQSVTILAANGNNDNGCNGGNQTLSTSFVLDNTGPTVTGVAAPAAGGTLWKKENVTVNWSATDPAGIASGPTPASTVVTAEGSTSATATATDKLGNVGSGSLPVFVDKTAPTISASRTVAPNAAGWNNTDVTVSFTCADPAPTTAPGAGYIPVAAGIQSCTNATKTFSADGANQTVTGTAVDNATNSASTTATVSIDKTKPTLSGGPTTPPNAAGWYNGDVTIGWTAADTLSGLAGTTPANSTISSEGTGLSASASVTDKAGNTTVATSAPAVKIDKTAPNTTATAPTNWNNTDQTVKLTANDILSGVKATYFMLDGGAQQTYGTGIAISTEGIHTVKYWSEDNASNVEASKTVQVKIDKTPPTITHTQAPAANANGWNNGSVTVTFVCGDALSEIASCTGPQTVATEGKDQPVTGTARDNAGNVATDPALVSIDTTAPTITATPDRAPNVHGWYDADVTIGFTCTDPNGANATTGSGVATCAAPKTLGEGANQGASGTVNDAAGNGATAGVTGINVDKTAPTLTGTPSATGWSRGDVTVTWAASDALSGLAGAVPGPSTVGGEGDNLSASTTVTDKAGNTTTATVAGIKIDRTAPNTAAQVPAPLATGWYAGAVTVTLTGVDGLSGVAKTYYSVDGGAPQEYTGSFSHGAKGSHTITFWSVDLAGNVEDKGALGHSIELKIDGIAPTITGSRAPGANAFGWNNAPVVVDFACTDAESGIQSCVGGTTVGTEGKDWAVTGTATDVAGNTAQATVGGISIDYGKPTLEGKATTDPNAAGWYQGDVTIQWTGTDPLAGIDPATQPANSTVTGEGRTRGAGPATVTDKAGNVSDPASVSDIKIDRTAPTITGTPTAPNAAGWYNGAVTVGFTCADPNLADKTAGSGVATCPSNAVLDKDGAGQSVSGSTADVAGNASLPITVGGINIDGQAPQTTANNQCDGKNGYCRGQKATVVLTATDQVGLSGVKEIRYSVNGGPEKNAAGATVSIDVPLAAKSGLATVTFSAVDNAGNIEEQGGVSLKFDNIAPTVTHTLNPQPNAADWNNSNVTVHFAATDDDQGSGVDPQTVTPDQTVSAETPGQVVNGQADDLAGNRGTDAAAVKLDKTAPTVGGKATTAPNEAGWYNGPVAVHFTCDDKLAGVATCPADQTVTTDGANQTATGAATDKAGNTAQATVGGLNIDTAAPTITGAPTAAKNAHGWYNGPVTVHFTCADKLAGIQECPADMVLSAAGANQTATGTAVDKAGNAKTYTVTGINIDLTAPTLTGAPTATANAAGWYNDDVAIAWTATDDLSGVDEATQPANGTVTGEGDNLGTTAQVADKASNTGKGAVGGIKIDRTAPTITGIPTAPNAAGWYKGAVTVGFTCADNLSGVASCPSDKVLSADGAGQSVTSDAATDKAGNSSTGKTVGGINIDTQAPHTMGVLDCTAQNAYCHGTEATVHLSASDQAGLSGVKEIRYSVNGGPEQVVAGDNASVTIPLNGSGEATVKFHASDNAGNSEADAGLSINYDNVKPTVTPTVAPLPNAAGWNTGDVTVHFDATDDFSGVDQGTVTKDQRVTTETAGQVVTGTAADKAGNVGTGTVTVKLDKTAPTITGAPTTAPNAAGWYKGAVTIHFTCGDTLSDIASCPDDVTLTNNGASQAVTRTALDKAGNGASATVSGINIDATAPSVTITGMTNGATYTLGAVPTPSCSASDALSGLVGTCTGTLTGGKANGVGQYTYTATATDKAGNTTTTTVKYSVGYRFDGFLQPINDTAHQTGLATSIFKGGSTVPVKFQLKDAAGTVVQATGLPQWLTPAKGSATSAPVDESLYTDPATSGSTYQWGGQQYSYNWSTKSVASGFYYRIGVTLDDGQTYYVNIGLR
jgi:hypothetical protein